MSLGRGVGGVLATPRGWSFDHVVLIGAVRCIADHANRRQVPVRRGDLRDERLRRPLRVRQLFCLFTRRKEMAKCPDRKNGKSKHLRLVVLTKEEEECP